MSEPIEKIEEKANYLSELMVAVRKVENAITFGRSGKTELLALTMLLTPEIKDSIGTKLLDIEKEKTKKLKELEQENIIISGYQVILRKDKKYYMREFEIQQQEVMEAISVIIAALHKMDMLMTPKTSLSSSLVS